MDHDPSLHPPKSWGLIEGRMERKAYCEFRLLFCHFLTWIDAGASDRWHFLIGHCRHQPADTDVFPVVADLSTRKVTGWEKRRPEKRLCPQVYRRLCPHGQPNWQVWNEIFNVIALNSANLILNATVDNRRLKCQTIREKKRSSNLFYLHGQYHKSPSREFSTRPALHRW